MYTIVHLLCMITTEQENKVIHYMICFAFIAYGSLVRLTIIFIFLQRYIAKQYL